MSGLILDVSSAQGNVDWAGIKRNHPEVVGAIVKASEGLNYVNPYFNSQVDGAHSVGYAVGAYEFVHPSIAGTADDQKFISVISGKKLELGVWIDSEVSDGLDPATVLNRVLEDVGYVNSKCPGRTGIYTGKWFWDPNTLGSVAAHMERWPLWISGYVANFNSSLLPLPWTAATMWQFTDNYAGIGIDGSSWMAGDSAYKSWVGTPTPAPPAPAPRPTWPQFPGRYLQYPPSTIGQDVVIWQNQMKKRGWNIGVDGEYGPGSKSVCQQFQADKHLIVDGVVGKQTWDAAFTLPIT